MKTRTLLFGLLLGCALSVCAETNIKTWTFGGGQSIEETQSGTPYIDKEDFKSVDVAPGDYLWFNLTDQSKTDFSIRLGEFNGTTFPGCYLFNNSTRNYDEVRRIYLTEDLLAAIKEKDLRVYGHGTLTEIKLDLDGIKRNILSDRNARGEKTLWTGYYWMENYTTLELYPEAFNGIDLSQYKSIRFYHEANRENYEIKVAVNLSSDIIADNDAITHYSTYAELMLTDAIRTKLSSLESRLLVQMHKNGGERFNFTDIVLIPKDPCENCFQITF